MRPTRGSPRLTSDLATQPGDIVFWLDPAGKVIFWSAEAGNRLGYAPEEILGRGYDELLRPSAPTQSLPDLARIMAGRDFAGGFDCRRKDGTAAALYLYATAGRGPRGAPAGVVVVGREVTGVWRAEEAARSSERRFTAFFDGLADAVLVSDRAGRIVEANAAAGQLVGRPREQLVGTKVIDLVPPDRRVTTEAVLFELARKGRMRAQLTIQLPGGGLRDIEFSAARVPYDSRPVFLVVCYDVTERNRVAHEREASAQKYRRMFEAAPDAVFLETLDGRILEANDSACRMLGYTRAELLALRLADLMPPEALAWLPKITEALIKHGVFSAEGENRHKDGHLVPVDVTCSLVDLPSGPAVLAMVRDITERRRAERALAESERQLRTLQDNVPVGLFRTTRAGRFESANPAFVRMFGYGSADEVKAVPVAAVYADPDERKTLLGRLVETGRLDDIEVRARRKDGSTFVALLNVRAGSGSVYDGAIRDITGRKLAEERYRLLFESTTDSVAIADSAGRVIDANPACLRIYGYTADEVRGMNLVDVVAPESREEAGRALAALARGEPAAATMEMLRKDGTRLTVDLLAFVSDVGGERRIFSFTRDITERKRAEQALAESEEHYRTALDSMVAAAHVVDRDLRIVVANRACHAWYARFGLPAPEPGRTLREITPFLDKKVWDEYRQVFESGKPLITQEATDVAGLTHYTETRKTPVIESGKVVRVLTAIYDVTESVTAERQERALAEAAAGFVRLGPDDDLFGYIADQLERLFPGVIYSLNSYDEATQTIAVVRLGGLDEAGAAQARATLGVPLAGMKFAGVPAEVVASLASGTLTAVPGGLHGALFAWVPADVCRRLEAELGITGVYSLGLRRDHRLYGNFTLILRAGQPVAASIAEAFAGQASIAVERRLAEQEAREQRARLATTVANLPGMAYRCRNDESWTMEYVSEGALDLTGRTAGELVEHGNAYSGLVHPADRAWSEAEIRAALADRTPFEMTYRLVTPAGEKWVWEQGRGSYDEQGRAVAFEGFITDISELKRTEGELRASREEYQAVFDQSPIGIYRTTPDGRILLVNPALCRMLGYDSADELRQHRLDDAGFEPGYNRSEFIRMVESPGGVVGLETAWRRKDGGDICIRESARAVRDADGRVLYYDGTVEDITERKRAEQALAESEANFRAQADNAFDGISVYGADGRFVYANRRIAEICGRAPGAMLGLSFLDLVGPEDRERLRERSRRRLAGEPEPNVYEVNIVRPDGAVVPIELSVARTTWRGAPAVISSARDLTVRRQLEQARQRSEEMYRALAEAAPVAVGMTDTEGRWTYVSPRMAALHGYDSAEELLGQPATDCIVPEERERVQRAALAAMTTTGLLSGLAARGLRRDGATFDAELSTAILRGPDGAPAGAVDIVRDVTERNRARRTLEESEAKYRSVVERASDGICVIQDGRLRFINHRLAELAGYTPEELAGVLFADVIHPDDRPLVTDRYRRRLAGEPIPASYIARIVRRDGAVVTIEINAAVTTYEGRPADIVLVRDVSERQQAEDRLRASEERFRLLFEQSPDAIGVHQDGRIVMVNPACVRLLGYERPEELVGRPMMELLHPDDRPLVARRIQQALGEGRQVEPAEERFLKKDGSYVWVEVTSAPFVWQGRPALQARVRDITARRRAEQALRQARERAQSYLDVANVILVALDEYGRVALINRRGAEILGRTEAELAGADWFATCVPERLRAPVRETFDRLMAGATEHVEFYDNPVLTAAGAERLIAWHNALLRDEAGAIVGTLSSGQDVTDQRAAEARLAESEALYRRLLETSPDGVAVHQDGRVVAVNPAGARILGYDRPEELIGTEIMAIVHPDDRQRVAERVRAAMANGRHGELTEERFRTKDGSYVWVEVTNAPFVWQGKPAVQVRVRDVSERRWLQGKLEELTAQLEAIFRHVPHGLAAEHEGRVAYANDEFARLFGYDQPRELFGLPIEQLVAPGDRKRMADYTRLRLAGGAAPDRYTFKGRRRDGTTVEVENTVTTYTVGGQTYILGSVRPAADR